ncbi:MAG: formate dehydrogenase subunit gamma [Symbiobacteriia bacterium]
MTDSQGESTARVLDLSSHGVQPRARWIERFNSQERLQHIMLAGSVLVLILTGFPIKYAAQAWAPVVTHLLGGFTFMFRIHLVAASLMIFSGIYHLVWMVINFRRLEWSMLPKLKDLKDAADHFTFLLGWRQAPPDFGRYNYLEKFEYLAVFYGVLVMGLSGFVLTFPEIGAAIMPRWALDVFRVIHSNEGFVCFVAVAVGHFFWVHFHPSVFPSSTVWYKGLISEHHMAEEHPAEYRRWLAAQGEKPDQVHPHAAPTRYERSRLFIGLELAVYGAIFIWLFATFIPMFLE